MGFFKRNNPFVGGHGRRSNNPYMEQVLRVPIFEKSKPPQDKPPSKRSFEVDFDINRDED